MSIGMKVVLERVPPGDNWKFIVTTVVYNSLTDALNAVFEATSITDFYVEARKGTVSIHDESKETIVVKPKAFNIYGDK